MCLIMGVSVIVCPHEQTHTNTRRIIMAKVAKHRCVAAKALSLPQYSRKGKGSYTRKGRKPND